MKLAIRLVLLVSSAALAGCTTMAQERARKSLQKQCVNIGMVFLETKKIDEGGLFGHAGLMGECVEPNDPRLPSLT